MDLRHYFAILWRRKFTVIVTAVVTILVVIAGTSLLTPEYTASATLRVATPGTGLVANSRYEIPYGDRLMNTYAEIAKSDAVQAELAQRLELEKPPENEVEILVNTELMEITVTDQDPVLAMRAANQLAEILIAHSETLDAGGSRTAQTVLSRQLAQIEEELNQARQAYEDLADQLATNPEQAETAGQADESGQRAAALRLQDFERMIELEQRIYAILLEQYEEARFREGIQANTLSIVDPAIVPKAPSSPNMLLAVALAVVVGCTGGVGLAFLFENLDTRLYTNEQVEQATGLPTVGSIPAVPKLQQHALLNGQSPQGEAFRRLHAYIALLEKRTSSLALLITSAEPGEGKSTVAASLAAAGISFGRRVAVVDGDLRRPTLHTIFDLPNQYGLSTVLEQETAVDSVVQNSHMSGVWVVTSGPQPRYPAELLASRRMAGLIASLKQRFDLVLIDAPALLPVADAAVLAPLVDGVVLVVGQAQARWETVEAARKQLDDVKARPIGVVINRVRSISYNAYYEAKNIEPV